MIHQCTQFMGHLVQSSTVRPFDLPSQHNTATVARLNGKKSLFVRSQISGAKVVERRESVHKLIVKEKKVTIPVKINERETERG